MKAKTEKEIDTDIIIKDITLLSIAEYETHKDIIPLVDDWYWLRSPGGDYCRAASVNFDGYVSLTGGLVIRDDGAVRPALVFCSDSLDLKVRDKVKLMGYDWTIINGNIMLCDNIIGHTYFRKEVRADDANDYEKSDIKKWLENWWKERTKNEK